MDLSGVVLSRLIYQSHRHHCRRRHHHNRCHRRLLIVVIYILLILQVLKSLESSLHHYNTCLQLYNPSRYPRRWGIAALEMGMALGAMADLVERVSEICELLAA